MPAVDMEVLCYNKGCGQKFNPESNIEGSCQHHPGVPVFHDALKGWSCCKKRSTDFTEFLNTPGCTKGLHSNVKPVEPEKPANNETADIPEEKPTPKPIQKEEERPSDKEPMSRLSVTVGATLKQALEKQMQEISLKPEKTDGAAVAEDNDVKVVKEGTSCKNNACKQSYVDSNTNSQPCVYHPGVPIFHEGCKFWSCCNRKTSDFDNFLNQEGCTTGKHVWFKKEDPGIKKAACRYDWHQTAGFVTISVFSKVADPSVSYVEANQVATKIYIVFDGGNCIFEESFILNGVIDPSKSTMKMLGTKVEINLKKAGPGSWRDLVVPQVAPRGDTAEQA